MDFENALEKLKALKKENEETQKKRAALMPSFETEKEALDYAHRLASLRPGDTAKVLNEADDGMRPAVFVGHDKDGDPVVLTYAEKTKRLCTCRTSWHSVLIC